MTQTLDMRRIWSSPQLIRLYRCGFRFNVIRQTGSLQQEAGLPCSFRFNPAPARGHERLYRINVYPKKRVDNEKHSR